MTAELKQLHEKSKLPAAQAGIGTVKSFFEANKASMAAVLPRHVKADRMVRIALGALRTTPKLMQCTTESLMGAIMQCAQLGLEPNTPLGHAYLIPFKNNRQNRTDVQVIFGFRGLIDLARRSGQIESIAAHAVYECDEFDFSYGLTDHLSHKPAMTNRGEIVAFYCVAKLQDGGHAFEVMSVEQVERIRDGSQNYQSAKRYNKESVWDTHFEEMGRKTVVRRLFKYLPVSIEMATATQMDEVAEAGGNQHTETALEGDYTILPDDYEDQTESDEPAVITDINGEAFDAEKHATDAEGNPVLNKDGAFRAKPGPSKKDNAPNYASIAEAMTKAGTKEALDEATALSDSLPPEQKKDLRELYKSLSQKFA
jgi:recombination protein RecT